MSNLEEILNYRKNSENLSTSGQPTESELHLIKKAGFEIIINIRPESEMLNEFDEKSVAENLGIQYLQIPMTFDTLNKNILVEFFEQMEAQKDKKLFVHCHHNIRVSVLLAFYRILKLGWKMEDAYNELGKMMEINSSLEDFFNYHINIYSESGVK